MDRFTTFILLLTALPGFAQNRGVIDTTQSPHAKVRTFDLAAVEWTSGSVKKNDRL